MKRASLVLVILWSLLATTFAVNTYSCKPVPNIINVNYGIEDGIYTATVKYTTASNIYGTKYTLNVKVKSNKVVTIDFGNGGSIHNGINSSGYLYSGGNLTFEKDFNGNIKAATTTVTIYENGSYKWYKVRIE